MASSLAGFRPSATQRLKQKKKKQSGRSIAVLVDELSHFYQDSRTAERRSSQDGDGDEWCYGVDRGDAAFGSFLIFLLQDALRDSSESPEEEELPSLFRIAKDYAPFAGLVDNTRVREEECCSLGRILSLVSS